MKGVENDQPGTDDPSVMQFDIDRSPFRPGSNGDRLYSESWFIDYGAHRMLFSEGRDVQRPTVQFAGDREPGRRDYVPAGLPVPTKIYTRLPGPNVNMCGLVVVHLNRNET
jgi:hypothetical protein